MTLDKRIYFECLDRGEIMSVEWKQVITREKTEFEMRILQGKRKVRWDKRREGQNMLIEIHYSIKI